MLLRCSLVLALLCFASVSKGAVLRSRTLPYDFEPVQAAPADMMITLVIGLQSTDREGLLAVLGEVSHPANPKYGQHLSKAEVSVRLIISSHSLMSRWMTGGAIRRAYVSRPGGCG